MCLVAEKNPFWLTLQNSNLVPNKGEKGVHIPVMVKEAFSILIVESKIKKGVIIDSTVGTGGHLFYFLKNSSPDITFLGIDIDPDAIKFSQNLFQGFRNVIIRHGNYIHLAEIVEELNLYPVIGVLFDFGVSKFQLESPKRGFSFQREGPLDMRFSQEGRTALDLISRVNRQKLERILLNYGEESDYKKIAQAIIRERGKIKTTFDLRNLITRIVKRNDKRKLARVFQALRMAVNFELENVERGIERALPLLTEGGRIVTISYHSLEDRIVKRILKEKEKQGKISILTKKPIRPTRTEIKENPSSRSAKLRAGEMI